MSPSLQETLDFISFLILYFVLSFNICSFTIFTSDVHQPYSQIRMSLHGSLGTGQVIFLAGIYVTGNTVKGFSRLAESICCGFCTVLHNRQRQSLHTSQVAHKAGAYPGFSSMTRLDCTSEGSSSLLWPRGYSARTRTLTSFQYPLSNPTVKCDNHDWPKI